MDKYEDNEELLASALFAAESHEECTALIRDLFTKAEIKEMSRRILAAKMLSEGEAYLSVNKRTGLSTATISRVSRCLKNGDGYSVIIPRIASKREDE